MLSTRGGKVSDTKIERVYRADCSKQRLIFAQDWMLSVYRHYYDKQRGYTAQRRILAATPEVHIECA